MTSILDEKISELTDGGIIQTGDDIPIERAGANFRVKVNTAATQPIGTFLQAANNLSDLGDPAVARANLGIGSGDFLEMSSGTSYNIPAGTSNVTLFVNSAVSGTKNITITASANLREILIKDWYGNSETSGQEIVIALASGVIDGLYASIEISTNKGWVRLLDSPLGVGITG